MFREGELNNQEEEVIYRIMLNPDNDNQSMTYYRDSNPVMWVADHLNYRITQAGGMATTPSRRC